MKKRYLKPEVENIIVNTAWALCDNPGSDSAGGDPDPTPPGAPRRRVF